MKITVTQEDIDMAIPNCCFTCPIARALMRETGALWEVHNWGFRKGTGRWRRLTKQMEEFVNDYDCNVRVSPFTFSTK